MRRCGWLLLSICASILRAQNVCPATAAYGICDITFDVPANTPANAELDAEFRGPSHRTFLLHAYASGTNRMTVRFSPFEAGTWDVRISSSIEAFQDKQLQFKATVSDANGWIEVANIHHFRYTGGARAAHLWLGDTAPDHLDRSAFEAWANPRIAAGVTHIRLRVPNSRDELTLAELDEQLGFLNSKGLIGDLVLAPPRGADRGARQQFFRYVIARYAARNITWVMLDQFEKYDHAHELLREMAGYLDDDPFHHLRTAGSAVTSGTFADEKWMNFRSYGPSDLVASVVEDQIYPKPAVREVRGDSDDDFRHDLWNTTASGAYPETATKDMATVKYIQVWRQLMGDARFWDEEPFFDAEGARGIALPDTEYVLYVEKPGPVTVHLERKHKWSGEWINPLTGEQVDIDNFKEDSYSGAPPDASHDWVLHIYREGHKESLKSYRFAASPVILQEIEVDPAKTPFEIAEPSKDSLTMKGEPYAARLKKETRASRQMLYLWTGEVTADDEGYRVLGTGAEGTFQIPANIVRHFPATLHVRLFGLNGLGKLYSVDRNFEVNP